MQREPRLGDILDDYCPRERRLTNHVVVAMVGQDIKQTRCTTCDAEHEYKNARVPRQRRKADTPAALYSQVLAGAPKRVTHDATNPEDQVPAPSASAEAAEPETAEGAALVAAAPEAQDVPVNEEGEADIEEGPVHRPLIRATLPRPEGQTPPARPAPEFTIRQPGGRPGRFRPRHQRGGHVFQGNRSNGNVPGSPRGVPRQNSGRSPQGSMPSRLARRHDPGRKRSK